MSVSIRFLIAGAILLGAILAVVAPRVPRLAQACPSREVAVLLRAMPEETPQPRWTGCFDQHRQTWHESLLVSTRQVRGAVAAFEVAAQEHDARALQDLGAARALSGDSPGALATLGEAAADPNALSNRSAAHLLAGASRHDVHELALALDDSSHAVALAPRHRAALYNQALALTWLRLDDDAERAWRHYLAVDSDSVWSRDVRRWLGQHSRRAADATDDRETVVTSDVAGITEQACREAAQTCRERVEDVILPAWADAYGRGDGAAAAAALGRAKALAAVLAVRGDGLDEQAAAQIERLSTTKSPALDELARGISAYGRARAAFENDETSVPLFQEAESRLGRAGSPLAGWARTNRVYRVQHLHRPPSRRGGPPARAMGERGGGAGLSRPRGAAPVFPVADVRQPRALSAPRNRCFRRPRRRSWRRARRVTWPPPRSWWPTPAFGSATSKVAGMHSVMRLPRCRESRAHGAAT